MPAHLPREQQVPPLRLTRLRRGQNPHLLARLRDHVGRLRELPADHRLAFDLVDRRRPARELQQAHVLLLAQYLEGLIVEAGGQQHLDELLRERPREGAVHGPVDRDHAAIGALRIAREGAFVGLARVFGDGAAAGVVVLDDRAGGCVEGLDELPRRAQVQQVVERQLLAV